MSTLDKAEESLKLRQLLYTKSGFAPGLRILPLESLYRALCCWGGSLN